MQSIHTLWLAARAIKTNLVPVKDGWQFILEIPLRVILMLLLVTGAGAATAGQVGNAFSYQGRLQEGSHAASGLYDFSFQLYDAATLGNAVGATITLTNVAVTNGLFTSSLDFGTAPFNGTAYWIEIGARSNGVASFTTLAPRQALAVVPMSIFASQAGLAATVSANSVTADSLKDGSITAAKIAKSQTVKGINGLTDGVGLSVAGNITLATNGNNLVVTGNGWSLSGNSGTSSSSNLLGTTDRQALNLSVNNRVGLRIDPTTRDGSFNIVGGNSVVSPGLYGVTISGGGETNDPNTASSTFAYMGGGRGNTISTGSYDSTVVGGYRNLLESNSPVGVIGGGELNIIYSGSTNSTIAGGSQNLIGNTSSATVIGGGEANLIDSYNIDSLIAGGWANTVDYGASGSSILGGELNQIGEYAFNSTISGGMRNTNTGEYSVIGGGATNQIEGLVKFSVISGGMENLMRSNGLYGTMAGGVYNEIGDVYGGTISGGGMNYLGNLADYATIGGGNDNYTLSYAQYSTIPGGSKAGARDYGQMAYASGCFANYGDAQASLFVLRVSTTNAVTSELFLDGAKKRITVPDTGAMSLQVMVVGRNASGSVGCFEIKAGVKNVSGTLSFIGGGTSVSATTVASELTLSAVPQLRLDSATSALIIRVSGAAGQVIHWVARIQTVEVQF